MSWSLIRASLLFGLFTVALSTMSSFGSETPWTANQLLQPEKLAEILKTTPKDQQPLLLQVGFQFLYKNGHLPGSKYVGPANDKIGLKRLRTELEKIPRNRQIVIYCGCCPFAKCPNIRPAFKELQKMGFKNVKLLYLTDNFKKNWIDHGYPTEVK